MVVKVVFLYTLILLAWFDFLYRYRRLGRIFNYLNKNVLDCLLPSFLVGY